MDKNTDPELMPPLRDGDDLPQVSSDPIAGLALSRGWRKGSQLLSPLPWKQEFGPPSELSSRVEEKELSENVSLPAEETNRPGWGPEKTWKVCLKNSVQRMRDTRKWC